MLVWHVTLAFWSRRSLWGAGRFEDDANPWVESSASQPSPELPLLNSCCLVCCIPWLLPELFVELLLPPGDSPGSSAGCTTCTSDCSETQPRGVGKARKPRFNKLPAEKAACSQPRHSQPPEGSRLIWPAQLRLRRSAAGRRLLQHLVPLPPGVYFCSRAAARPSTSINRRFSPIFFSSSQARLSYPSPFFVLQKMPRDWPETITSFLTFFSAHLSSFPSRNDDP